MISDSPSLVSWSLSEPRPIGIESFVTRYVSDVTYYGSGKAAIRDGLAELVTPGENVLLPAYLPDAVAEPFHELGLEPRYYRLRPTLEPDLVDLERRMDDRTAVVMTVDYFGFPQPGLEEVRALVDDYGCYHVDDNAHAPLSVDGGTLLGTRGHLGFTSLWKLLPVQNGAMLYCNDETVAERFEPSSIAGVREDVHPDDCLFALKSVLTTMLDANGAVRRSVDGLVRARDGGVPGPGDRYEAGKCKMSRLSAHVAAAVDPLTIRETRRRNYRAWRRVLDGRPDVEPLFDSLPAGICPQVFPVRATDPDRFLTALERSGVVAHTWPRLPTSVRDEPAHDVACRLAREVVVLPVHQHVDPTSIDAVGERLES